MVFNKKELSKAFSPNKERKGVRQKRLSGLNFRPKLNAGTTSKMKVVIRVRPQNETEMESNQRCVVQVVNKEMLVFDPKEDIQAFFFHGVKQQRRDMLRKQNKELKFDFDCVFDGNCTNGQVFNDTMEGILASLLDGFNCSVFAYGATGAGKTFTMLGSDANPGITYLTMVELYRRMAEKDSERSFDVNVSYLEVYNENVHDLLKPSNMLHLRDNGSSGVHVAGLEVLRINNADDLIELLRKGNLHRTQHPTDANAESSRSHAVFQLHIRMTDKLSKQVKLVKLSMIDLAGSERASATGCRGMRFTEGANINKSLLALGNCINALSDGLKHIPYRDSKLTRLLKDSLGGNCNTVMIANVSPSLRSYEDTYNTLKYASRAKKIKSKLKRNIVSSDPYAAQYGQAIEALKLEVAALKQALKESEDGNALLAERLGNTTAVLPTVDPNVLSAEQEIQLEKCRAEMLRCYEIKKSLHMGIMKYDGLLKLAKYRKMMKLDTCHRLKELCFHDRAQLERALQRTYKSLVVLETNITNYNLALKYRWEQFGENMNEINSLEKQITEYGVRSHLDEDITGHRRTLNELEMDKVVVHLLRLSVMQRSQQDGQDLVIMEMAKSLASYHAILEGNNLLTHSMQDNYITKIRRMLEGIKLVSWGQSHEAIFNLRGTLPVDKTAFEIPPNITEYMSLEFSKYKPQAGNPNNISQLNYSKEDTSARASRYSVDMDSVEKFVRCMTGDMKKGDNYRQDMVVPNITSKQECNPKNVAYKENDAPKPVSINDLHLWLDENVKDCIPNLNIEDHHLNHPQECRPQNYVIEDHFSVVLKDESDFNRSFSPAPKVAVRTSMEAVRHWLNGTTNKVAGIQSDEVSKTEPACYVGRLPNPKESFVIEDQMESAMTKNGGNFMRLHSFNETFANKIQMEKSATTKNVDGTSIKSQERSKIEQECKVGRLPNLDETFVNEEQIEMATTKNVLGVMGQEISKIEQARNVRRSPKSYDSFINEEQIEVATTKNVRDIKSQEISKIEQARNVGRLPNLNETFVNEEQIEMGTTKNVLGVKSQEISKIEQARNVGRLPNLNETFVNKEQTEMATTKNVLDMKSQEISQIQQGCNVRRLPNLNETFINKDQIEVATTKNVIGIPSQEKLAVKIGPTSNETSQSIIPKVNKPVVNKPVVNKPPAAVLIADNVVDIHCREEPRVKITDRIPENKVQHVTKLICKAPEANLVVEGQGSNINANLDCTFVLKNRVETKGVLETKKSVAGKNKVELKRSTPPNQSPYLKKKCNKENNVLTSVPVPQKNVKRGMEAPAIFLKPSSTICVPKAPKLKTKKEEPRVLEMVHRTPLKPKNELLFCPGGDPKKPMSGGKDRKPIIPITPRQYPYNRQTSQPTPQRPLLKKS